MIGTRTAHVRIEGLVQKVGYRAWTQRVATELKLTGWVRNLADGAGEAVFQGENESVAEMISRCGRGPQGAVVKQVEILGEEVMGTFEGFEVRATAAADTGSDQNLC
ncbi:acylphosphatase [Hyphomicrobium nitrativorans NL23]|uniref:acylphosphatase n=1 Tax=Hyphomicrobium nitrativorans NL23 TaxID=1029756 RepID=V5SC45_9HYPH|nr:acylphosphatase [Hyphomicrobium nitrativorans]AHB48456.1 acylphosphatase [Hyphomicrobium nitrativorans NL23]